MERVERKVTVRRSFSHRDHTQQFWVRKREPCDTQQTRTDVLREQMGEQPGRDHARQTPSKENTALGLEQCANVAAFSSPALGGHGLHCGSRGRLVPH